LTLMYIDNMNQLVGITSSSPEATTKNEVVTIV
jgi:hypothetical protein